VVSGLVEDIGAEAIDAGPLSLARYTEPAGMLLVMLANKQKFGARIGLRLIQETGPS
jgi:predicted dinucleotide-binding enzyme